ncbi:hypothetical protein VTH06DRAFT_2578 [Thermothelomyces fergusii]
MSIARAFTTRRAKQSSEGANRAGPHRSQSTRGPASTIRHKISSPVELIHTTNMLSYSAPDIHPMSASSTGSLQRWDDDMSDGAMTSGTTPPTSPEAESPSNKSASPQPNHLSSYFAVGPAQHAGTPTAHSEAPAIPQRAASHTKKQHKTLVRQRSASALSQQSQRSVSTKGSFSFSRSSSGSTSTTSFDPPSPPRQQPRAPPQSQSQSQSSKGDYPAGRDNHPFGNELAQVSELAEEYGVKDQVVSGAEEEEEQEMARRGLRKISADEYLSEVRSLFAHFIVHPRPVAAEWI